MAFQLSFTFVSAGQMICFDKLEPMILDKIHGKSEKYQNMPSSAAERRVLWKTSR